MNYLKLLSLFLVFSFSLLTPNLQAQNADDSTNTLLLQEEAFDCINATLIDSLVYREIRGYNTSGNIYDEIKDDETCIFDQEERSIIWYIFNTSSAGELAFMITPDDPDADLDWVLFDFTNASCEDLSIDPAALVRSCNAAGGAGCHGRTGMSYEGEYNNQGGGCDPLNPDFGNNPINATLKVDGDKIFVLAIQNWGYAQQNTIFEYTIDFSESTANIIRSTPAITDISASASICDAEPITLTLNQSVPCDNINQLQVHLIAENGQEYIGEAFSQACATGTADKTRQLVIQSLFSGAQGGRYQLIIDDTPSNRQALSNENGNSMLLPVELEIDLITDNSLDVSIINRTPNSNLCAGEIITLRASEIFDFFENSHLYTWTRPDGSTSVGRDLEVISPGIYTVDVLQNGALSALACKRGTASIDLQSETAATINVINNSIECLENLVSYKVQVETEFANTIEVSLGTITGSNGLFTIRDIPTGEDIQIRATSPEGCETIEYVSSPYCQCPHISAPQSNGNLSICAGDVIPSFSVSSTGISANSEIRWYSTPTGGATIAIGTSFTPSGAGVYYAGVYNVVNDCVSPRTAVELVINPTPTASISGRLQVCPGETTTLTASLNDGNATRFTWSNGANSDRVSVYATTHTVTITDTNGCESVASVDVLTETENCDCPPSDLPEVRFISATCSDDNQTYAVRINTIPEDVLTTDVGIVAGSSGFLTIYAIPVGQDVELIVTSPNACTNTITVESPECGVEDCSPSNLPEPQFISATCSNNNQNYVVRINTAPDDVLTTSVGIIAGGSGFLTIYNIPAGEDITATVTNLEGCETTLQIEAPDCSEGLGTNPSTLQATATFLTNVQVQPNPFTSTTNLIFQQTTGDWVELLIYDVSGKVLLKERRYQSAGIQQWKIEGTKLGQSGIYFYRLQSSNEQLMGKLILQE